MLNRDAEFLPRAISKSGAGQLDLLILEANALHGVVSLSYITCPSENTNLLII